LDAGGDQIVAATHQGAQRADGVGLGAQRGQAMAVGAQQVGEQMGVDGIALAWRRSCDSAGAPP